MSVSDPNPSKQKVVFITGLSGAGMTTYLKALENINFETIDNVPLRLIDALVEQPEFNPKPIAIGTGSRMRKFGISTFLQKIEQLRANKSLDVKIVYLHADKDVLNIRYAETGNAHPLAHDRPTDDAIRDEISLMTPIKAQADIIIDTTDTSAKQLTSMAVSAFNQDAKDNFTVYIETFGSKHGNPRNLDAMFTVRHFQNPYYVPELKEQKGLSKVVQDYVRADQHYQSTFDHVTGYLDDLLPRLRDQENDHAFTLGIGCKGGHHRSVTFAEDIAQTLKEKGYNVVIQHNHIDRGHVYHAPLNRKP